MRKKFLMKKCQYNKIVQLNDTINRTFYPFSEPSANFTRTAWFKHLYALVDETTTVDGKDSFFNACKRETVNIFKC